MSVPAGRRRSSSSFHRSTRSRCRRCQSPTRGCCRGRSWPTGRRRRPDCLETPSASAASRARSCLRLCTFSATTIEPDRQEAFELRRVQAFTPESAGTTHVFLRIVRNYATDRAVVADHLQTMFSEWAARGVTVLEHDTSDYEPSLGSLDHDHHPNQENWAMGDRRDLELDGAESGIGDIDGLLEQVGPRDWQAGKGRTV